MGSDNGNGVIRDAAGRFLPGTKGGTGRPPGTVISPNIGAICRARAEELGFTVDDMVWAVMLKLYQTAVVTGDVAAARIVLDRLCGPVKDAPLVNLNFDQRSENRGEGPPIPDNATLVDQLRAMARAADKLEIIDAEVRRAADEEVEEILDRVLR